MKQYQGLSKNERYRKLILGIFHHCCSFKTFHNIRFLSFGIYEHMYCEMKKQR